MSLRDYFAVRASEDDVQHWMAIARENGDPISREDARYWFADAMLKAREES